MAGDAGSSSVMLGRHYHAAVRTVERPPTIAPHRGYRLADADGGTQPDQRSHRCGIFGRSTDVLKHPAQAGRV